MDDESSSDIQKCLSDGPMETDEGPLLNENSNGLSHFLTEGEFNSVDAVAVDDSSTSNQGFLNAVELSTESVGDYLQTNSDTFNPNSFDVGDADNAVTFPSDSLNVLSDGDSRLSDTAYKAMTSDIDSAVTDSMKTRIEHDFDLSNDDTGMDIHEKIDDESNTIPEGHTETNDADSLPANIEGDSVEASGDRMDAEQPEVLTSNDPTKTTCPHCPGSQRLFVVPHGLNVHVRRMHKDLPTQNETEESREEAPTADINEEPVEADVLKDESNPEALKDESDPEVLKDESDPEVLKDESNHEGPKDKIISDIVNIKAEPVIKEENDPDIPKDVLKVKDEIELKVPKKEVIGDDSQDIKPALLKGEGDSKVLKKENLVEEMDIKKEKGGGAEETEVVSEDELPEVQKPSVKDAENVSDDELPGPKPAELPADTEVVSEDELPASKKESKESRKRKTDDEKDGYDPGSPTSESESSNKKQAIAKNGESKPVPAEKRASTDEKPKKKALPELDKYWKVVNDDPTDFTGWTYLLQYVDQESEVEAAREAYDAFLSHYPYCYGYWRKYADYEKRKGSKKKCLEVLERGLKAIPLSVDLWIHYLNHVKSTRPDDHAYIRAQYERSIEACGLEFRSDRLWELYIKWEAENGTALNVTNIYDRLLATPTLGYTSHFDSFQEHVMSEPVRGVISEEELIRLRAEVRESTGVTPQLDLPPGEDEPPDHVASEEEAQAIKERIIAARRKVHKATGEQVAARWTFEEGIKRPYFHVKPLERCQLKNWKAYLEWEKQHGSLKRALVLHERCLIACALYEEFWIRLVKFLSERSGSEPGLAAVERAVLERACGVHHPDKPELHLHWAHFEEAHGHPARAADILERIEKACPQLVQIQYRRVNLERRRGDYEKCAQLYESYIAGAKNKAIASALSIKYARFLWHVRKDPVAARKVLDEAIVKEPLNPRLHMQRLDLALHTPDTPYEVLEELVQSYEKQNGAELEIIAQMAARRRELAEELGTAADAREAQAHARRTAKLLRKRSRKDKHDAPPPATTAEPKKKEVTATTTASTTNTNNNAYYAAGGGQYDPAYQTYQPPWGYQQPPYQHHPHPWPQYPNYY